MATQAQIQVLIDQIVTGANYKANQMNPLLTDILTSAYGPMFIDTAPPTPNEDETGGYRPGSVAYDTSSKRFYICKAATAGAADWVLIPSDANYEYKLYSSAGDGMTLLQNTSVFKADNNDLAVNLGCYVNLPANPYRGKVVILYFQDAIDIFDIRDSLGTPIIAGASLTIIGGDQYTIVYNGSIWEIIGIANINPATLSGVAVSKGATSVPNTTFLNFIGASVTVAPSGSGANVTINDTAGVNVKRGSTTIKSAAQFIGFNLYYFDVEENGTGADVTFVQRITVTKNTAARTNTANTFDFNGSLFDTVSTGTTATVTMNGAKTLTLAGTTIPAVTDDGIAGYSRGSVAINTGTLLRTYICTDNTTGAAQWRRITEDNGYESPTLIARAVGDITLSPSTANVVFAALASPINGASIVLPANAYVGKKVFISFRSDSTSGVQIRNGSANIQFTTSAISGATITTPKMIIAVCTNESTQTWVRLQ
jgi:hypothetical protein